MRFLGNVDHKMPRIYVCELLILIYYYQVLLVLMILFLPHIYQDWDINYTLLKIQYAYK